MLPPSVPSPAVQLLPRKPTFSVTMRKMMTSHRLSRSQLLPRKLFPPGGRLKILTVKFHIQKLSLIVCEIFQLFFVENEIRTGFALMSALFFKDFLNMTSQMLHFADDEVPAAKLAPKAKTALK